MELLDPHLRNLPLQDAGEVLIRIIHENGPLEQVQEMIDAYGRSIIICQSVKGPRWTAMFMAVGRGRLEILKYLIKYHKGDVTKLDNNGWSTVFIAATFGHLAVLKYLVEECKVSLNPEKLYESRSAHTKTSILEQAAMNGHLECIKYIIKIGANVNQRNSNGATPLHEAITKGHFNVVRYLVEDGRANTQVVDNFGQSILIFPCVRGNLPLVKYIVEECNVDVNMTHKKGHSPIHFACYGGHIDVVQYLTSKGAELNTFDGHQLTPVAAVCKQSDNPETRLEIVRFLIEKHKVHFKLKKASTSKSILHLATGAGNLDLVQYLVQHFPELEVDDKDANGDSAVHYAAALGHVEMLKVLIVLGHGDAEMVSEDRSTPLHKAAMKGHIDACKYLVEEVKVNVNRTNAFKRTPAQEAEHRGMRITATYLFNLDNETISNSCCGLM